MQQPALTPTKDTLSLVYTDAARIFLAVFLLRPCTHNMLVEHLHLPTNTIRDNLNILVERGLLSVISPPVYGGTKGESDSSLIPHPSSLKFYDLAAVVMHFAQLAEHIILPILDENRILRAQRQHDLEYQARQLTRIRQLETPSP